ncbi:MULTISPECIES: AI-2E family transporter [Paenibacillus]|uniref:AI-2E family transporter n=1 Tax=Paenibacillus vini TaxID=1476024 RepID=A0ABQ4M822_9BACL|nr:MULTISPECIES: AI-2E family transporter [Paenibacillus]MBQ4898871.1 AI-2E family transporter [Paenibacillus sp. Marseille-P2973]MDN4066771.1 AI-2E family transporter [Paenibacillus vini]GIP52140.1 AI-2E family transporter [Paenibacillus vini]
MTFFKELFQIPGFRRVLALLFVVLVLYYSRSMLNMVLITFILTYLINRLHNFITRNVDKVVRINRSITILLIYVIMITLLVAAIYYYLPVFIAELTDLVNQVISFYDNPPSNLPDNLILNFLVESLKDIDLSAYIDSGFNFLLSTISDIGKWSLNLFVAIVLSLFFLLEKEKVTNFTAKFKASRMSGLFVELEYFGKKFVHSFGKVIEVQFLIALVNSILSTIFLWIFGFPNLIALAIMIFLLGLIPVMGVIISLIPLCAIAFKIGGLIKIVYVLIMIAVVHAVETYFLNPKFMSNKTHLPIFYTFLILLVSEHFFGVWGLIVGVPIFMFLLDILEVPVGGGKRVPPAVTEEN